MQINEKKAMLEILQHEVLFGHIFGCYFLFQNKKKRWHDDLDNKRKKQGWPWIGTL